ncbi:winged helix-turn-helix transcriptional regulator [Bradyrhizobium sp.]|uniref:winged helix-turn-helix transcriptional regulator n=1 Tax=Bradyrhizobium sp. TaxID=376 RepID=UPI001D7F5D4D|nr:helix-turn-helix domain-containing protein [Bradyrhizobium sp.]MBV8700303.1 helix-turn-helix transcriptional regulator [Bradyrhizobium sp.]MBV8920112.1 helix-turn-helix transcriptional regulator [Bradyrhizobium sp.]MBV9979488.1 helix-turn-helix transcriptional regulator [Bradyrhizobium sp.]
MPVAKDPSLRLCPLIAFDRIAGGRYKLRTLWTLIAGTRRYGEIRQSLVIACQGKPVTPRILSRELKELQHRGLIQRKEYRGVPPKVEYCLTDLGSRLIPVIEEIIAWGQTGAHETSELLSKREASAPAKRASAARPQ